jgi:hypothetical protein
MRDAREILVSASNIPVALATALFLGVGRRFAGVSGFAEVLWQVVFRGGSAVGQAGVVAVSQLVGAGHCWGFGLVWLAIELRVKCG